MELFSTTYLLLFFTLFWLMIYIGYIVEQKMLAGRKGYERLLITVARGIIDTHPKHDKSEVESSTDFFKLLNELNIPFTLETAVHGMGEEIHFYIIIPRHRVKNVSRLIESIWPTAQVSHAEDYDLWLAQTQAENDHVAMGYLSLAKPFCIPLKTGPKGHFEPFLGILRWFSGLSAIGEGAAIQWVIRRADSRLISDIGDHLQKFRTGQYHPSRHIHENFMLTPESIKLLETKANSPLFAINCRLVTASISGRGKIMLSELSNHFEKGKTDDIHHNAFRLNTPKKSTQFLEDFFTQKFDPTMEMILTADELATYFHFPISTTPVPKIRR